MQENQSDKFFSQKNIGGLEDNILKEELNKILQRGSSTEDIEDMNKEKTPKLSFGEKAVGLTFNPGGMKEVNSIKKLSADLIDELNNQRDKAKEENNEEKIAQFTLAIRSIQEGQLWGVKAATWKY